MVTKIVCLMASLLIAASVLLAAIGFLGFALYLALLAHLTPPIAALVTAAAAVLAALLIALIGRLIARRAKPRTPKLGDSGSLAIELGKILGGEFSNRAAAHPYSTMLTALLSGFMLGASPDLRHILRDLVRKL